MARPCAPAAGITSRPTTTRFSGPGGSLWSARMDSRVMEMAPLETKNPVAPVA